MKIFRISLLVILGILDVYFAYATIGYFCQSFDYPKIIGDTTARFCGVYIMMTTFLICFIITTIIYIIILRKLLKMEKRRWIKDT